MPFDLGMAWNNYVFAVTIQIMFSFYMHFVCIDISKNVKERAHQ